MNIYPELQQTTEDTDDAISTTSIANIAKHTSNYNKSIQSGAAAAAADSNNNSSFHNIHKHSSSSSAKLNHNIVAMPMRIHYDNTKNAPVRDNSHNKSNNNNSASGNDIKNEKKLKDIDCSMNKMNYANYSVDNDRVPVPVSEMYDEDIDYMNKYLKSLPDYNDLNNKINKEFQKCEEMYDQLQSINSGLKNNPLAKSSSYQSIHNKRYAQQAYPMHPDSKICRSTSSSIIPQYKIGNVCTNDMAAAGAVIPIKTMAPTNQLQPPKKGLLQKSSSNSAVNRSYSKQFLNDFWCDNIAKTNSQKMGWNYNKIMAASKEDIRSKFESPQNYRIQKNLSLSQLDKKIRQDLSKEELYSLICNDHQPKPSINTTGNAQTVRQSTMDTTAASVAASAANLSQQSRISSFLKPLSKSISQSSVPCNVIAKQLHKSSSKSNIPGFFRPLCKSTSNTHVFSQHMPSANLAVTETFSQKGLAKSSSSSSIPISGNQPFFLRKSDSTLMMRPQLAQSNVWHSNSDAISAAQRQISKNNVLLKSNRPKPAQPNRIVSAPKPQSDTKPQQQATMAENFFVKQSVQQPNQVVINYPPFTKISTIQIPINGHLPSAFCDNNITQIQKQQQQKQQDVVSQSHSSKMKNETMKIDTKILVPAAAQSQTGIANGHHNTQHTNSKSNQKRKDDFVINIDDNLASAIAATRSNNNDNAIPDAKRFTTPHTNSNNTNSQQKQPHNPSQRQQRPLPPPPTTSSNSHTPTTTSTGYAVASNAQATTSKIVSQPQRQAQQPHAISNVDKLNSIASSLMYSTTSSASTSCAALKSDRPVASRNIGAAAAVVPRCNSSSSTRLANSTQFNRSNGPMTKSTNPSPLKAPQRSQHVSQQQQHHHHQNQQVQHRMQAEMNAMILATGGGNWQHINQTTCTISNDEVVPTIYLFILIVCFVIPL